jgi:hypothetical protein
MSKHSHALRAYWKPRGRKICQDNERHLKKWMYDHGFSTQPGTVTVFIHSRLHESAREHESMRSAH